MKYPLSALALTLGPWLALTGCSTATQTPANPMHGGWRNKTEGHVIGIQLGPEDNCQLFVERFMQPRAERECLFEPLSQTRRFLVFLKDENGLCGNEADYEFTFEEQAPLLRFYIGGSEIVMYKEEQVH